MPSCAQYDDELLASDLANTSVLMLGDSTSAQLLWHTCEAFYTRPASFVPIDAKIYGPLKRYSHRLRSLDNHVCRLRSDIVLGSFSHYGVAGPPYWVFAYPLAPWLANTSLGMLRDDVPRFTRHTHGGEDPTLVVASSGFWDIASWWAHEGNFSKRWSAIPTAEGGTRGGALGGASAVNYTERYLHGVHRFVREARRAFPRSTVVWRLMHPGMKHSITPRVVARLNAAVRSAAPSWRLPLLDVEAMMSVLSKDGTPGLGKGPPYGTQDGRHLHPWLNIALLNVMLNMARAVRDKAARDGVVAKRAGQGGGAARRARGSGATAGAALGA